MNTPPPSTDRTQAQQESIASASRIIRSIDNLNENEDFRSFMGEHAKRAHTLALDILDEEKLTQDEREKRRNIRTGIMEVLLSPEQKRSSQVRILSGFGIVTT